MCILVFKVLCLFFLPNFPDPMFIPCPTSIPEARVCYNQFLWSIKVNLKKNPVRYEIPCIRKATTALVQYYSVLYDINRTIMWCSFSRGPIYLDHKRRSNRLVRYGSVMTQRFLEGSLSVLYIPHRRSKMSHLLSSIACTIKL